MSYKSYQKSRDAAWEILIRHRVGALPVDVISICRAEHIYMFPYSTHKTELDALGLAEHARSTDGFSVRLGGHDLIFYGDRKSRQRQRFTIAHELGHFINGDVSDRPTYRNTEPSDDDDEKETAANRVACRILSPACVLWRLGLTEPEEIALNCDISITAARWRSKRMKELLARDEMFRRTRGRSCFLQSPLERAVFYQFFPKG